MTRRQPNMLWIMTDQHRWDVLGCYGHRQVRTPALDALRAEGVRFDNVYTPSPVCGPTRAALFTGCYPPRAGVTVNWMPFNPLRVLLPEYLKHAGYSTGCVGKLHFVPHLKTWGFDEKLLHDLPNNIFANDAEYSAHTRWLREQCPEHANEWIAVYDDDELSQNTDFKRYIMGQNHVPEHLHMVTWTGQASAEMLARQATGDRPFFHYASFIGPHHPYAVPSPWADRHTADSVTLPEYFHEQLANCPVWQHVRAESVRERRQLLSERDYREAIAAYYNHVEMIDHSIGRILDALRASGRWDDTLIVFASDHGDHCGQYGTFFKGDMYDSSCKVPLLMKLPGGAHRGATVGRACSLLDLFGTLCDAAGDRYWREDDVECASWWKALSSEDESCFKRFASEPGRAFSLYGGRPDMLTTMIKKGDLKLMRQNRSDDEPLYELHDLAGRTGERRCVTDEAAYADDLARLRAELDAWTDDQIAHFPERVIRIARRPWDTSSAPVGPT